ncbi:MAG: restriction endonuclease, partial [Clostridia bacterium]|nr:restriction endonuclease [Clostridia bacterium]
MGTILESIEQVLSEHPDGLTSNEIYQKIIDRDLYHFGAQNPLSIVNGIVRRHCAGLDFPSAHVMKRFKIVGKQGKTCKYALLDQEACSISEFSAAKPSNQVDALPEEQIQAVYKKHIRSIKTQLLNSILNSSPQFFEELVVELLVKMGYGYGENAGHVTRYCKDGGIDGIIEEDRLGLDKIYVQAKRYGENNKVTTDMVDQFTTKM